MVAAGEPPFSMYDLINALTQVQNEDNIRWNDRSALQHIGGVETIDQVERCRSCHHAI